MSGLMRQWIRAQRDHLVRADLERQGYVLDWLLVYRLPFSARMKVAVAAPTSRMAMMRAAGKGSSRRLHAERMARTS